MWLIWIGLVVLIIVGILLKRQANHYELGEFIVGFTVFVLTIMLMMWPCFYYSIVSEIAKHRALRETVDMSRLGDASEFERVALTTLIVEANMDIAKKQYWNETFLFDIYIPDEIMEFEPIR